MHSVRRTKASHICRRTKNLRAGRGNATEMSGCRPQAAIRTGARSQPVNGTADLNRKFNKCAATVS